MPSALNPKRNIFGTRGLMFLAMARVIAAAVESRTGISRGNGKVLDVPSLET